jgi:hypothetical protein
VDVFARNSRPLPDHQQHQHYFHSPTFLFPHLHDKYFAVRNFIFRGGIFSAQFLIGSFFPGLVPVTSLEKAQQEVGSGAL